MKKITSSIVVAILLSALNGCGTGAELSPEQVKKVEAFDVSQIDTIGEEIHKGMNQDELLFYAPVNIVKAKESYESALSAETKTEKMSAYLVAKKSLANAYESKKLIKRYLSEVAEIDAKMKLLDTQAIFSSRYDDFKNDYYDLIVTFDEGQVSDALKDKKEVMINAKDLYGDAVVYRNINKAKIIIEKLSDEDLDEVVPKHFEQLEKMYENARLGIKREPDNAQATAKLSKEVNETALYTQTLAKDVVKLKSIDPEDYERYLDRIHHQIIMLNAHENVKSILPLSIEDKVMYLKRHIKVEEDKPAKEAAVVEPQKTPEVSQENNVTEILPVEEAVVIVPEVEESVSLTPVEDQMPTEVEMLQEEIPKEIKEPEAVEDVNAVVESEPKEAIKDVQTQPEVSTQETVQEVEAKPEVKVEPEIKAEEEVSAVVKDNVKKVVEKELK